MHQGDAEERPAPNYADTPGYTGVNMIVEGFNENDVVTSMEVSLHPQLVFYDVQRSDGSNVGLNPSQFGRQTAAPGEKRTYYWYAGDVQAATVIPDRVRRHGPHLGRSDQAQQQGSPWAR